MALSTTARPVAFLLLIAALTAVLLADAGPARATDHEDETVQEFLGEYTERHGLPGAAVAVIRDGEVVEEAGVGGDGKITARTPMGIGSVTKVITAFAVLQLVDAGELSLGDPVEDHLPGFAVDDRRGADITVGQLLSHTSGLPNPMIVAPATSPRERVSQLRTMSLRSDPGTTYAYSNLGYHVAARLIEVTSGRSLPDHLHDRVFEPLGMHDTRSTVTKANQPGLRDGHVTAYGLALPMREMAAMNAGAGDVVSTAHDLGLWLAMIQRRGTAADGTRLLSEELVEETLTRQPGAGSGTLGWQHTQSAEPARIGKDGALTRHSARVDLVPSSGHAVVVLLNSFTPTLQHQFEISTGVIELTQGRPPELGTPVPTIIDAVLGLLTLLVVALTVRGVRRAPAWAARRSTHPTWRFLARLLPQLLLPALAVYVFGVLPLLEGNSATPVDAFGLWPAVMTLLLTAAAAGVVLTAARAAHRTAAQRTEPAQEPQRPAFS